MQMKPDKRQPTGQIKIQNKYFKPKTQVLILEPTDTRKLKAMWQGPATILHQMQNSPKHYKLLLNGKEIIRHVNCLREYHTDDSQHVAATVVEMDQRQNDEDR